MPAAYVTRGLSPAQCCLVGDICLVEPVVEDLVVCSLVVTVLCHLLVEGLANLLVLSLGSLAGSLQLLIPALAAGHTRLQNRHSPSQYQCKCSNQADLELVSMQVQQSS